MTMLAPRILLGSTFLLGLGHPALAQTVDAETFAQRVQALYTVAGFPMEYAGVRTEGSNVILEGVSFGGGDTPTQVGEARFETVSGSDADGWRAERGTFDDFESTDETGVTSVQGLVVEGLTIAREGEFPASGIEVLTPSGETLNAWMDALRIGGVQVVQAGEEVFSLGNFSAANEIASPQDISFDISAETMSLDIRNEGEAESLPEQIGYERLEGSMAASGAWNTTTGDLSLAPLQIDVDDAAALTFAYRISGYTPAFMAQLTALQEQMAARPDNRGASGMAIVGLLSQLTIHSAELRVVDQSVTNRLLDHYAQQNGQTREALIDQLVASLPGVLANLNNPQFQAEVSGAVDAFLRDPQSITAAIAPAEPVPAAQIMGAAMGAPQTLPAVLSLTVRSND